jgi:hypothetical protein
MNDRPVHPDEQPRGAAAPSGQSGRAARLATWALGVGLLALAGAAACAAMVLRQNDYHLQAALYVVGLAAAVAIGLVVVAILQRRVERGGVLLVAMLIAAAALAAAVWAQAVSARELALDARRQVVLRALAAVQDFAKANGGQLPANVSELRGFDPSADVAADLPKEMTRDDYILPMREVALTLEQLAESRGDRQVILVHDGGQAGRDPTVAGMLDGSVRVMPWVELRGCLDRQEDWIYRLSRRLNERAPVSRPATASAPATTRAASAPSRPDEPAARIRTTVPADVDDQ